MNALTVELSSEVHEKVDLIAAEKGVTPEHLLSEMTSEMVMQHDAHRLFLQMAERGKGREEEALALLQRD
jgi:predicted transcriptional regulator